MRRELIERIAQGATVVTPNRRLARALKRRFDGAQLENGRAVWPSADVLPWSAWLERLHGQLHLDGRQGLLSASQELALWQQVIADSRYAHALLDSAAIARIAREAASIQAAWRLDLGAWRSGLSEDGRAFLVWLARVKEICAGRDWLDSARLADAVSTELRVRAAAAPRMLVLYGFDLLDPQQRDVLAACRAAGALVEELAIEGREGDAIRHAYVNSDEELIAVAHKTRDLLCAAPRLRIGVVVPELTRLRARVVRTFDDVLQPDGVLPGRHGRSRAYDLSLGVPLSAYPLIHAALSSLCLIRATLPFEIVGMLLRSPFLGGAEREMTQRAMLDVRLRRRGPAALTLEALRREARSAEPNAAHACPVLVTLLDAVSAPARDAGHKRRLPSAWSATFFALLHALGWPGERTLDSEEYQTYEKWREVVLSLSVLDPILGALSYDGALEWLRRLCADTLFQAESEEVPIQVFGVLESAGIEVDALFVTGLHDERWPPAARPNPLLPAALQRLHGVPHASAEWELGFARRATALWCGAATQVMFSHPQREEDRPLRPSPLLSHVREQRIEAGVAQRAGYAQTIRATAQIERLLDTAGPALKPPTRVPGGATVFQNQSACPFRAFALHRLHARALEQPVPGLDASRRGVLLHSALAALWDELRGQRELQQASPGELRTVAGRAAAAALERFRRDRPGAISDAFAGLERARMVTLLERLLELEKQRAPFTVIAREQARSLQVAGLEIEARIDRIDELEGSGQAILDYKTGGSTISAWVGERPDEPQVPLYAVTNPQPVSAVSLVTVNAEEVAFRGLASAEDLLPGVATPEQARSFKAVGGWQALLDRWRSTLERLAREFLAGEAAVAPKIYPRTCELCDLDTFCRVKELLARGRADIDDAAED